MAYRSPRPPSDFAADAAAFREPAFRDALAAAVALVTHADGAATSAERDHFFSLMEEDAGLQSLPREALRDALAGHDVAFGRDPQAAAVAARDTLAGITGRTRLCSAVVRVCRAIIPADGVIHPAEHRALAEIRSLLGMTAKPVVFGADGASGFVRPPVAHDTDA